MKLGIIADTHNQLDPSVGSLFQGVSRIVHAGDVCRHELIAELESVAPVTVVAGNNDFFSGWRETEYFEVQGHRFLVEHIVQPDSPTPTFRARLLKSRARIVVFGHTHRPYFQSHDGVLYLNPGSAGAPRFKLPRSVCILHLNGAEPRAEFISLDPPNPSAPPFPTPGPGL